MRYTLGHLFQALDLSEQNSFRLQVSPENARRGNPVGFVLGLTDEQFASLVELVKGAYAQKGIHLTAELTINPERIPMSGVTPKTEAVRDAAWILAASEEWRSTTRFGQFISGLEVESLQDVRGKNGSNMLLEGDVVFEPAPGWSLSRRGATELLVDWMAYRRGYLKAIKICQNRKTFGN